MLSVNGDYYIGMSLLMSSSRLSISQLDEILFATEGPDAELSYQERQLLQYLRKEERRPVPATGPSQAAAGSSMNAAGAAPAEGAASATSAPSTTSASRQRFSLMVVLKVVLLIGLVLVRASHN